MSNFKQAIKWLLEDKKIMSEDSTEIYMYIDDNGFLTDKNNQFIRYLDTSDTYKLYETDICDYCIDFMLNDFKLPTIINGQLELRHINCCPFCGDEV